MNMQTEFSDFVDDFVDEELRADAHAHSTVICAATDAVPVIYVSDAFETHTGYPPAEAIGRSLSFLQGPNTEAAAVQQFRELIQNGTAGTVRITNYRKDQTPFLHECEFRPIHDDTGALTHFIAIQRIVSHDGTGPADQNSV